MSEAVRVLIADKMDPKAAAIFREYLRKNAPECAERRRPHRERGRNVVGVAPQRAAAGVTDGFEGRLGVECLRRPFAHRVAAGADSGGEHDELDPQAVENRCRVEPSARRQVAREFRDLALSVGDRGAGGGERRRLVEGRAVATVDRRGERAVIERTQHESAEFGVADRFGGDDRRQRATVTGDDVDFDGSITAAGNVTLNVATLVIVFWIGSFLGETASHLFVVHVWGTPTTTRLLECPLESVDHLGVKHLDQGQKRPLDDLANVRVFENGLANYCRQVYWLPAPHDSRKCECWKRLGGCVITSVIAKRTFHANIVGVNESFKDYLCICRYIKVDCLALDKSDALFPRDA